MILPWLSIGKAEKLSAIKAPLSDSGAPTPHVFSDEHSLFCSYFVAHSDPNYSLQHPIVPSETDADETVAVIVVDGFSSYQFGPPNDEAISGHRLYKRGLRPYSTFEVSNSTWIARMERANRVHSNHRREMFDELRHFIFTFHDTTLEFVAKGFSFSFRRGAVMPALLDVVARHAEEERLRQEQVWRELLAHKASARHSGGE